MDTRADRSLSSFRRTPTSPSNVKDSTEMPSGVVSCRSSTERILPAGHSPLATEQIGLSMVVF